MVESGLGHVVLIAHVPFAEEGGAVSVLLEVLREKDQIVGLRCLIVHEGMGVNRPVRMEARLGEESDVVTNAFFRQAPSRAMRSSAGVCSHGTVPVNPMKS